MKIGVNLYPLRPRIAGGHEIYVRNLLNAMLRQGSRHTYCIITAPWNHRELDFGEGPYQKIRIEAPRSRLDIIRRIGFFGGRTHTDIYRCAMAIKPDVWFCPMLDLNPRHINIPSVVTVPDIQHEFYPEFFSADELQHRALMIKPSCQLATAVITVSDYSRASMLERLGLEADKVHRIYEAAGPEYNTAYAKEAWAKASKQYGLQSGYLFYPANTWPHKNHDMLLMSLQRLRKRGLTPRLVLSGAEIETSGRLKELAAQLGCAEQLVHLGYVERSLFPGLYAGAACLAFPSLFEGFGIPLVEAMGSGCPVACSNACSIPEVVGDAALIFDPRNPDSIADALEKVLRDEGLRRQLSEMGIRQASRFSWDNAARETLAVFEKTRANWRAQAQVNMPPQDAVEGYFADGWAGPQMLIRRVELSRWRALVLEGETNGNCSPIEIRTFMGRSQLEAIRIESPGPFSQRIEFPPAKEESGLEDLKVQASGHFVPKKLGINEDTRKLSFLVRQLALVDLEGKAMVLRGRH